MSNSWPQDRSSSGVTHSDVSRALPTMTSSRSTWPSPSFISIRPRHSRCTSKPNRCTPSRPPSRPTAPGGTWWRCRPEGFVIPQVEVARFFERMLPKLGLNERESSDFRAAWLPRFHDAPYYFITFLSRETIDRLAPLVVTPKPDAVIRVLMDFRPLRARESVQAPNLPTPPERRGFTVVEWGGILR